MLTPGIGQNLAGMVKRFGAERAEAMYRVSLQAVQLMYSGTITTTGVTPNQVSIIEIVPDGRDGWVERPRSLVLNEN